MSIQIVNFSGATRTRNRVAYSKRKLSFKLVQCAQPRITKEKKQDLEKLCKKNLISERYHSFYDNLEVIAGKCNY